MFKQLEGFGSYGFPESHAASFALIAYASSWLKCHHPDVFCAALLNSQPMGFYAPAQIVRDAREHGVEVLPPDILASDWDCTLESVTAGFRAPRIRADKIASDQNRPRWKAVRLGFRQIKGLKEGDVKTLVHVRAEGARTPGEFAQGGVPQRALELLAEADVKGARVLLANATDDLKHQRPLGVQPSVIKLDRKSVV